MPKRKKCHWVVFANLEERKRERKCFVNVLNKGGYEFYIYIYIYIGVKVKKL